MSAMSTFHANEAWHGSPFPGVARWEMGAAGGTFCVRQLGPVPCGSDGWQFAGAASGAVRGCHAAPVAWSPDGKWMYFTSKAGGLNHIWRQRFADGQPQQFTFGITEEEGIAMAPDGRSLGDGGGLGKHDLVDP